MKNAQVKAPSKSAVRSKRLKKVVATVTTTLMTMLCFAVSAFATNTNPKVNTAITTDGLVGGIIGFICTIAMYVGFVVAVSGIFMFIMAYKDDNAESQSRGARLAIVGAVLIGLKPLLKTIGLTK